jgi:crotonobetainyl-CoA:carnitine CoA-transferase CaiB-like acyl-CoA transferase
MNGGALSPLKVVEYSDFISGPYCGKLLADLGAEIIKVEKPGIGDKARSWGPFPQDIPHPEKSGLFLCLNTNKLGITLDVGTPAGAKLFRELVKWADILVENNPPKEMEKLRLDYESLNKINPRLVMTSITPFGQTGPYRDYKSCDLITFNMSGMAYINPPIGVDNLEKQPPLKGPRHSGDFMAAIAGAIGTMSAVMTRLVSGLGQHVDLSEQESLVSVLRRELDIFDYDKIPYKREKNVLGSRMMGATGFLPSIDGPIALALSNDKQWGNVVEMMGNPEWTQNPLFQDRRTRRLNQDAVNMMVGEWTKERTWEEICQATEEKHLPCMLVSSVEDMVHSEQIAAREFFIDVEHQVAGKIKYPGAPYKLSGTPWGVRQPAPLLGEHNEEVYCRILGHDKRELVKLRQAGVI